VNIDGSFLSALIRDGKKLVTTAKGRGITPEDLDRSESKEALTFLYDYVAKYDDVPPEELLTAKMGADLETSAGSAEFWIDEVLNRRLFRLLQEGLNDTTNILDKGKSREAFEFMETMLREIRRQSLTSSPIESMFSLGPEVLQQYEDIKSGKRGIQTRWPTINDSTLGFWPQDLVMFVARVATGKTWSSIIMALDAWAGQWGEWDGQQLKMRQSDEKKKRVLYVTTEISKIRIASRFYAVKYKLPYREFRSGRLDTARERRFYQGVQDLLHADGLSIVGGDFDFTIGGLEAAIDEAEPDLLVLDGAYLIKGDGKNRTEQAASVFNEIKRLIQRTGIAGVVTSQLNRSANPNQRNTVNTETIALTDVAGWNSDMVIGMIQSDDDKEARRMFFKPLKVREGEGREIELNWDFMLMNFDEMPRAMPMGPGLVVPGGPPGGDADEGGVPQADAIEDDMPF
jgi:replicative DNA helicase